MTEVSQALSPNPCTALKMTSPTNGFFGSVGAPITLTATATCPVGQTPEYQFWVKPVGTANWSILGPFVPGSSSWSPPTAGNWAITVVTRVVGAPEPYQVRASAITGTVTGVADNPPVAVADAITTNVNTPGSVNVLTNDSDPDGDTLSVSAFTQGAHGVVKLAAGVATYTPANGFSGSDSFSYTLDDGHGMTSPGSVNVTVSSSPACTVSITGPTTGLFGQTIHLDATASCVGGSAELQWYHKVNSAFIVVQPFGATASLDYTADFVGPELFYAAVRTQGTTPTQAVSSTLSVAVADNTPQCTQVKVVAPTSGQTVTVNAPATLTASATCPSGTPEFQFWVKPVAAANWQILPGYTTGNGSWTPPTNGAWAVKAAVRTTGSHVPYQLVSAAVAVTVGSPAVCGNGVVESGEQCDDGNTTDGDGCSHTCQIERCGDGIIQLAAGETCDDGNTVSGDGCDSMCHVEPFQTTPPVQVSLSGSQSCTTAVANAARKISIDGSGTIYAVMTCDGNADVVVSHDRGLTFSAPLQLATGINQVAVNTGPSGVAYVAIILGTGDVQLRTTTDAGATWEPAITLGQASNFQAGLSLQSFNDDLYVGFASPSGITVARNHTRGVGQFDTTDVQMNVVFFDLLFDVARGTLAVCADTPSFHVRASSDSGVTFASEVNPPGSNFFSDWAIGNGNIYVVGTNSGTLLYVIPTSALSTSVAVSGLPAVSASQTRSIAADPAGNAFVASQLGSAGVQLDRLPAGTTTFDTPRLLDPAGLSPVVAPLPGNTGAAVVYTTTDGTGNHVWITVQSY